MFNFTLVHFSSIFIWSFFGELSSQNSTSSKTRPPEDSTFDITKFDLCQCSQIRPILERPQCCWRCFRSFPSVLFYDAVGERKKIRFFFPPSVSNRTLVLGESESWSSFFFLFLSVCFSLCFFRSPLFSSNIRVFSVL